MPFYFYLGYQCLVNGVAIRSLAKANYALDHGEIGIASKLASQQAFDQDFFLPSILIGETLDVQAKKKLIYEFVERHDYPVILKSDLGCVGKGIAKLSSAAEVEAKTPLLLGRYILQKFTAYPYECGVFYTRYRGKPEITGINKKHFPAVTGNGKDTLLALAKNHPRYNHHWSSFLQYLDLARVPADGEQVRLSFIGSHTLGCKFTDDTNLLTPELKRAIFDVFADQPGFNFGRVDIKAESEQALRQGDFVVIEINGVASLPTHMFDPKYTLWQAYKIFFEHGKHLVRIAREHRDKPMALLPYREIVRRVRNNQALLNRVHHRLKENG